MFRLEERTSCWKSLGKSPFSWRPEELATEEGRWEWLRGRWSACARIQARTGSEAGPPLPHLQPESRCHKMKKKKIKGKMKQLLHKKLIKTGITKVSLFVSNLRLSRIAALPVSTGFRPSFGNNNNLMGWVMHFACALKGDGKKNHYSPSAWYMVSSGCTFP